jgi:thiol-disulfide isomerase/thioredoxin
VVAWTPSLRFGLGSVEKESTRGDGLQLSLKRLDGAGAWSVADQRGKVVLLNFWATWCPPCRMETPDLVALHREYASRGVVVAGVSLDDDPAAVVPAFVQKYGVSYPILLPDGDLGGQDVSGLPTTLLIDRQGRVARRYVGMISDSAVKGDIERLLSEPGGSR